VIDAVRSGAPAGTIHRLDVGSEPAPAAPRLGSTHAVGLAEAVELGRALGRLPARLELYGIEGARFDAGAELTPAVERAVEALCGELRERLAGAPRPT
jgi:hydrogenase maturation protease